MRFGEILCRIASLGGSIDLRVVKPAEIALNQLLDYDLNALSNILLSLCRGKRQRVFWFVYSDDFFNCSIITLNVCKKYLIYLGFCDIINKECLLYH